MADALLTDAIKPLCEKLVRNGIIDQWFFIRYSDPQLHLRIRFHVTHTDAVGVLIREIHAVIGPFVGQDLVARIQTDTYQREIERYGVKTMELAERLYFHDSVMQVKALEVIHGDEGENLRWLFGLKAVDGLLDDFSLELPQKKMLVREMKDRFVKEFNGGKNLKNQLVDKFRKERSAIENVLNGKGDSEEVWRILFRFLNERSAAIVDVAKGIRAAVQQPDGGPTLNELIPSFTHMTVNRLFRTRQRIHEMVLYDFLDLYYKSEIARKKYDEKRDVPLS